MFSLYLSVHHDILLWLISWKPMVLFWKYFTHVLDADPNLLTCSVKVLVILHPNQGLRIWLKLTCIKLVSTPYLLSLLTDSENISLICPSRWEDIQTSGCSHPTPRSRPLQEVKGHKYSICVCFISPDPYVRFWKKISNTCTSVKQHAL